MVSHSSIESAREESTEPCIAELRSSGSGVETHESFVTSCGKAGDEKTTIVFEGQ
jgi:hypothetical protein